MSAIIKINSEYTQAHYQLVIFDVDGTLVDSFTLLVELLNAFASKYQYPYLQDEKIEQLRRLPPREIRKVLGLSWWKTLRLMYDCKKEMRKRQQMPTLFSDVLELLQALKQREIKLAIVTSNHYENCLQYFGADVLKQFDWIECDASIYGKAKQIQKIIRRSGYDKQHIAYVGDQIIDVESAHKNQIDALAVAWGFNHPEALMKAQPTVLIEDISQLRAMLLYKKPNEDAC